ncbi:uncharacterized protein LOC113280393 [Papaver somniferum]|uniref:uncharacterized protein LOC113280393 n=1 Tax=Papaver somniferum TaxID=3469 RepID=UPI000E7060C4|nr:uncharacterized protein LOC113280393 [Papaver somniferum]
MVRLMWGNNSHQWAAQLSRGAAGGMLTVWDDSKIRVDDILILKYSVTIKCVFLQNGFECILTNVYGPADEILHHSKDFWEELDEVRRKWSDVPWCLGGDFNCIFFVAEKNRNKRSTTHIKLFDSFMRRHGLFDLPLLGGCFTWSSMRGEATLTRIDRFIFSGDWEDQFPKATQHLLRRNLSDHHPISLRGGGIQFGPYPFRFENFLLKDEDFLVHLKDWWQNMNFSGSASFVFSKKLQELKILLKC